MPLLIVLIGVIILIFMIVKLAYRLQRFPKLLKLGSGASLDT